MRVCDKDIVRQLIINNLGSSIEFETSKIEEKIESLPYQISKLKDKVKQEEGMLQTLEILKILIKSKTEIVDILDLALQLSIMTSKERKDKGWSITYFETPKARYELGVYLCYSGYLFDLSKIENGILKGLIWSQEKPIKNLTEALNTFIEKLEEDIYEVLYENTIRR